MTASPKPKRGTFRLERLSRRKGSVHDERMHKEAVRERDGHKCRWPKCGCYGFTGILEVAHLVPKSLGGSSDTRNMILICSGRHRGSPSLHSQELCIEPKDRVRGADGPCEYYRKLIDGGWILEGAES